MPLMTHAARIAEPGEDPGLIASIQAMLARIVLLLTAAFHVGRSARRTLARQQRWRLQWARWFAYAEARARAGDRKAFLRIIIAARRLRRAEHREATFSGRFYRRRRAEVCARRFERRIASRRRRPLTGAARIVPFAPVNPAPP